MIHGVKKICDKENKRTRDGKRARERMIGKNLDECSWVQITNYTFLSL